MSFAHTILGQLLRPIFPHVCEICGKEEAGPAESFIGPSCRAHPKAIRRIKDSFCDRCGLPFQGAITTAFKCANCADLKLQFVSARAATVFSGLVKEVIHRYKYGRQEWFEPFLAELLIEPALPDLAQHPVELIVPIPLHRRKLRHRGFNQAEHLASRLSSAAHIPLDTTLLKRVRETDSQARLDRDDREANVKNAFEYRDVPPLNGQTVLLIDDVLTTGLTASACARELLQNGAREVRVWTVARGTMT